MNAIQGQAIKDNGIMFHIATMSSDLRVKLTLTFERVIHSLSSIVHSSQCHIPRRCPRQPYHLPPPPAQHGAQSHDQGGGAHGWQWTVGVLSSQHLANGYHIHCYRAQEMAQLNALFSVTTFTQVHVFLM